MRPSLRPSELAAAALEVASAGNPRPARTRALPASQALAMTKVPRSCSARSACRRPAAALTGLDAQRAQHEYREHEDAGQHVLGTVAHGFFSRVLRNVNASSIVNPRPCRKRTCRLLSRSSAGAARKWLFHTVSTLDTPSMPAA